MHMPHNKATSVAHVIDAVLRMRFEASRLLDVRRNEKRHLLHGEATVEAVELLRMALDAVENAAKGRASHADLFAVRQFAQIILNPEGRKA